MFKNSKLNLNPPFLSGRIFICNNCGWTKPANNIKNIPEKCPECGSKEICLAQK